MSNRVEIPIAESRHCDDYIRDKSAPKCLRKWLLFQRKPSMWKWKKSWGYPALFATFKEEDGPGGRKGKTRRVRVVMASRFGDVGISKDLDKEYGYYLRVFVSDLTDLSETDAI